MESERRLRRLPPPHLSCSFHSAWLANPRSLARLGAKAAPSRARTARVYRGSKVHQQALRSARLSGKLCPRDVTVGDKERGYCGVRENRGGVYYTLVHSRVCAAHVDPVEKKPLFHYLPGSIASRLPRRLQRHCKFCQNWDISQSRPEQIPAEYLPPQRVAEIAKQYNCPTIAYTYSEPVIFSEFLMDAADAGHAAGIRSIVVSNGYMQEEA